MGVSRGKVAAVREHQIVISLKPEQFQEVQKQARAAGAQSVGAFVRQNLLLFLGLEEADAAKKGASSLSPAVQADPDWKFIASELRRLHRELKVLSSEAAVSTTLATDLSGTNAGPLLASSVGLSETSYSEPPTVYHAERVKENFLTDGAPVAADDYQAELGDEYEESLILPPAHGMTGTPATPYFGTPAIRSPFGLPLPSQQLPLTSPFSAHTFMPSITPLPADLGIGTPAQAEQYDPDLVEEIVSNFARTAPEAAGQITEPVAETAADTALPLGSDTSADPAGIVEAPPTVVETQAALEIPPQPVQPPPSPPPPPAPVQAPAAVSPVSPVAAVPPAPTAESAPSPGPVSPSANEQGAFAPQKDDMEVLADRAFAISPRLGAIEPEVAMQPAPTRSFADTLEELLDAGLINQVLSQPEEEIADPYAGEVQAPPEDFVADEDVQVYVQEVEVASSADATDSESGAQSDNDEDKTDDDSSQVIQHEPPPPPKPIGYEDKPDENEPPKPPPRRKKLM